MGCLDSLTYRTQGTKVSETTSSELPKHTLTPTPVHSLPHYLLPYALSSHTCRIHAGEPWLPSLWPWSPVLLTLLLTGSHRGSEVCWGDLGAMPGRTGVLCQAIIHRCQVGLEPVFLSDSAWKGPSTWQSQSPFCL